MMLTKSFFYIIVLNEQYNNTQRKEDANGVESGF